MQLDTSVTELQGVGPIKARSLRQLGIETVYDLIHHYPSGWSFAPERTGTGGIVTIVGKVVLTSLHYRLYNYFCTVRTTDNNMVDVTWFNGGHLCNIIHKGSWIIASGKLTEYGLTNPVFKVAPRQEALPDVSALNTVAYPVTKGITSKDIARAIRQLPESVWEQVPPQYSMIHFPHNQEDYTGAVNQIKYDELYYMQLGLALRQHQREQEPPNVACILPPVDITKYFPFDLTDDQTRAIEDITCDLLCGKTMNRLLQGDVGCGKTVVAAYAAMLMAMNGGQTVILCPTQILAQQHYESIKGYFEKAGLKCSLILSGRTVEGEGYAQIIVGTTTLLSEDIVFRNLGLVVIDEQHKFGVEQRAAIKQHGNPHCLVMTATPIPRTIAMTAFGDLDVSTIKEMPPGRMPVKTHWTDHRIAEWPVAAPVFWNILWDGLNAGRQIYIVCPRIEALDDEMRAVEEVAAEYARLFSPYGVIVLHGKLSQDEKNLAIEAWVWGENSILVSTTVVEVGVDNPNATVMVIEGADRFGLATLHQLRGRVGRSTHQSYCFLLSDTESTDGRKRLRTMEQTNDGFLIAEEDLRIRGPGDLLSTRQHGLPDLRLADLVSDYDLMLKARDAARAVVAVGLDGADRVELERRFGDKLLLGDS